MGRNLSLFLCCLSFFVTLTVAESEWNILNQRTRNLIKISLKNYCESWRMNGEKLDLTTLEEWISQGKAPALEHLLKLFNEIKARGLQIILVSSRREHLRSATINNLVNVGFYGWTSLILRGPDDEVKGVQNYKADARKQLMSGGYSMWGILGEQYSSIEGLPRAKRTFKLPNPLYYVS